MHAAARTCPPRPQAFSLLAAAGVPVDAPAGPQGLSPLHLAIMQQLSAADLEAAVAALLSTGASARLPTAAGDSPLHLVQRARRGRAAVDAIQLLLAAGADPNALNVHTGEAPLHTCLHEPVSTAALAALRVLLDGGASPTLPCRGVPPLHTAAAFADGDAARSVMDALLDAGADANQSAANGGGTAMHVAASNLHSYLATVGPHARQRQSAGAAVIATLVAAGASANATAAGGLQPLHVAAGVCEHPTSPLQLQWQP